MNAKLVILGALALLAAPLAYAHDPAGIPKNYCEPQGDWAVHDYGPPATGSLLVLNEDGNLAGDCDGITTVNPGTPCAGFEDPADPLTFFVGLCDADFNPPVADFDGHTEWALGGAWLYSVSGPGTPGSGGTLDCFGAEGHHTEFGTYSVEDVVLGAGASFSIAADRVDAASEASGGTIPPAPCGDFETDESIDCIGACNVPFGAGLDGAYIAFVQGSAGHVTEGGIVVSLCGPDDLQITGANIGGNTYQGQVTLTFTVGVLAVLTGESVVQTGGPAPNPNPIVETGHTGTGGGSTHTWTIGGSGDFDTREFTYTFETTCSVDGSVRTTTGIVNVYN